MQEVNSIVGGDKMMSFHHNLEHHHHALKCPRCDSFNTKFCYYNNYNLTQPRHFCKNCRRYWTKGGVLRNVPVGGGSRKSKKSNKSKMASSSSTTSPAVTISTPPPPEAEQKTETHSNSESSTFTTTAAVEEMSKTPILNVKVNSFSNLVTSSSTNNAFSFGSDQVQVGQCGDSLGQWQLQISNGFGSLDWHGGAGNGLFGVPNTVDQSSYWTHSHWSDHINHPSSLFQLH